MSSSNEVIYTDGACKANGTKKASGGFGLFIASSSVFNSPLKVNKKGELMEYKSDGIHDTYYVTNIRMEGLAIVSTMALYAAALIDNTDSNMVPVSILNKLDLFNATSFKPIYGPNELTSSGETKRITIEIVTDSLFWMNVIGRWMPNWVAKGIVMDKKNPDILLMLRYYCELLHQNKINVVYTHVKSHQKGKRTKHADGNDVADVLATSSEMNCDTKFHAIA